MSRNFAGPALAAILLAGAMAPAQAQTGSIGVPDRSFPESITSTKDGTLYFGSFNLGGVMRVAPGGKPEPFIKPGASETRTILGVLADEKSGTLYVCSNDASGIGVPGPSTVKGAFLKTFDLASGAAKNSFPLKDATSFCNDIVVGDDGTAYVTDTFAPYVYSLKPGAKALEVWMTDPRFAYAKGRVGLDGIAFGADGQLYVTTFVPGQLFRIAVKDGKAGEVTQLKLSKTLDRADAMRRFGDALLLVEGGGSLDKVTMNGDDAQITVIQDGLAEPVSVTQVGNTAWVAQGQLSYLFGENKDKPTPPFTLKAVDLSAK